MRILAKKAKQVARDPTNPNNSGGLVDLKKEVPVNRSYILDIKKSLSYAVKKCGPIVT